MKSGTGTGYSGWPDVRGQRYMFVYFWSMDIFHGDLCVCHVFVLSIINNLVTRLFQTASKPQNYKPSCASQ